MLIGLGGIRPANIARRNDIQSKTIVVTEPDVVQALVDQVELFAVESEEYANGIEITKVYLKTDAASTLAVNIEEWTSPTDGAPATIVNVASAAGAEANAKPSGSDGQVAAGSVVMDYLDTTDVNWAAITILFRKL